MDQPTQSCTSAEAWLVVKDAMRYANITGCPAYRRETECMMDAYFARCDRALHVLEMKGWGARRKLAAALKFPLHN